jgi:arsenate reductase
MKDKNTILFICTGNTCRSQMAEGFMRKYIKKDFLILSAGFKPSKVNPLAVKVMNENGIDISFYKSNHVEEYIHINHEYVITVCDNAKEACPVELKGNKHIHWSIPDPYIDDKNNDAHLPRYRSARDLLEFNIKDFAQKINQGEQ